MQWGMEKWGARREGEEQVMAEEAAFEIFIPCRLMAFSAVDRMEELGRARREDGGRKFSCEWVPWRASGGRRGQNIFWKEATKGHYSDDHGRDGDERQKRERRKKFYRAT